MATVDLLKVKVFWNKGYNAIIFAYDVINKNLSRDSNYIVDVVMWPNFGSSSASMREVIITSSQFSLHLCHWIINEFLFYSSKEQGPEENAL